MTYSGAHNSTQLHLTQTCVSVYVQKISRTQATKSCSTKARHVITQFVEG